MMFYGWGNGGGTNQGYYAWLRRLHDEYDPDSSFTAVPGFLRGNAGFLNVPLLATMIFKLRSTGSL